MRGWQVKLCYLLVTHGSYLSALETRLGIIKRYTNGSFAYLLTGEGLVYRSGCVPSQLLEFTTPMTAGSENAYDMYPKEQSARVRMKNALVTRITYRFIVFIADFHGKL